MKRDNEHYRLRDEGKEEDNGYEDNRANFYLDGGLRGTTKGVAWKWV